MYDTVKQFWTDRNKYSQTCIRQLLLGPLKNGRFEQVVIL